MKRRVSHLTLDDRRTMNAGGICGRDEMARRLRRHRLSIFRALRRNHGVVTPKLRGYRDVLAQRFRDGRRYIKRKLVAYPKLLAAVTETLQIGWTPAQIVGRIYYEGLRPRVCQNTIYRHISSEDGRAA